MHKRNFIYDEIAGLLILYMILYHIMQWAGMQDTIGMEIMSYLNFFMPWFFFKGGMFFKTKTEKDVFQGSFKRLISPYILWSLIGAVIYGIVSCFIEHTHTVTGYVKVVIYEFATEGSTSGNLPLWYLLSLFIIRNLANKVCKLKVPIYIPIVFSFLIVALFHFADIHLPLYFYYTLSGFFFYGIGIIMKDVSLNRYVQITAIFTFVLLSLFCKPIVDIRTNALTEGFYLLWPVWSITGVLTINALFECLHLHKKSPISVLEYVGNNSMIFYVVHWPIITILFTIYRYHSL